jgi:hypothetical protein
MKGKDPIRKTEGGGLVDADGFLCKPDGTLIEMKMTLGTRLVLKLAAWWWRVKERL